MRHIVFAAILMISGGMPSILAVSAAHAESPMQNVDLILPANLASNDAPFYQEAQVKIGDEVIPVTQGVLPNGVLAQYQPENKAIVISNNSASSETEKGQALLDVMAGIQASAIAPAAGR